MRTFAGIEKKYAQYDNADILLQPVMFDGTSTWGKGADRSLNAFLTAAENMELYDIETDSEVYHRGIHLLPELSGFQTPEEMVKAVYQQTRRLIDSGKFLTFLGGEHSISIGIMRALHEQYPDLTIVQLDAHADLRTSYDGSPHNHACALHEISRRANVVQIGIRSMDISEKQYLKKENCYFAKDIVGTSEWIEKATAKMTQPVYITIDLDVFDPSIMPATGTPEPGGLGWYEVLNFIKAVINKKNVLGFDLVELAPIIGQPASDFLTAKLYYKLLSYQFSRGK
jgi:agmatinase